MRVDTAWVAPPNVIGGLDHLGTQGPCILIYSQLLPGITNVTDRARYYSFYPWLVWSFNNRHPGADFERFVDLYRRADCLFTMIAERHARVAVGTDPEEHGPAMVGRQQLAPAVTLLAGGEGIRLSSYATREEVAVRYFANRLGGLNQYYAGTLYQLGILSNASRPWFRFTHDRGEPLARAFDAGVPGDLFWSILEGDTVTAENLDALSSFCPCAMCAAESEHQWLVDLFFDRQSWYAEGGVQRRKSLALILDLVQSLRSAESEDLDSGVFRAAVYTVTLPGGNLWIPPASLCHTLEGWKYYVRNDILSVVMQTAFSVALAVMEGGDEVPESIESFAVALAGRAEVRRGLAALRAPTFGDLCRKVQREGPALGDWAHESHELAWVNAVVAPQDLTHLQPKFLASILRVLALLHVRDAGDLPPYGALAIEAATLNDSPINLASFRARCHAWQACPLDFVARDLLAWCLETHLRVALRKLRSTGAATFRVHPSELGLERTGDNPAPAQTSPRFKQATRILRDIGALTRTDVEAPLEVTKLGGELHALANV
jgi:hypothetical protein